MHFLSSNYGNRELEMTLEKNWAQLQWIINGSYKCTQDLYFNIVYILKLEKSKQTFTIYNYFVYLIRGFHLSNISM